MWRTAFLDWLLATSLMGCILTFLILGLKMLLGNKIDARWHYYLWFLLIARLALPDAPASPCSVFSVINRLLFRGFGAASLDRFHASPAAHLFWGTSQPRVAGVNFAADYSLAVNQQNFSTGLLFGIWLTGVIFFTVYLIGTNRRTAKLLKERQPVQDETVLQLFKDCRKRMNIGADIRLMATPHIQVPALYGIFSPCLLLPADMARQLTGNQLEHIFLHELAHYKHKDVLINLGIGILQIIHWFNPVLALVFHRMRREREAACDAAALAYLRPGEYQKYGETLLLFLSNLSLPRKKGVMTLLDDKATLKQRITHIAFYARAVSGNGFAVMSFWLCWAVLY